MCEFPDAKQKSDFYVAKTDSKTVLSLQTCRKLGMIQILNKVTSEEDNKKEQEQCSNGPLVLRLTSQTSQKQKNPAN